MIILLRLALLLSAMSWLALPVRAHAAEAGELALGKMSDGAGGDHEPLKPLAREVGWLREALE